MTIPDLPIDDALRRAIREVPIEGAVEPITSLANRAPALVADWLFETVVRHVGPWQLGTHRPEISAAKLSVLFLLVDEGAVPGNTINDLASSPSLPLWMAERIARADDAYTRSQVALNRHAPASILAGLASDPSGTVRNDLAGNEGAPAEVLSRLARDDSSYLRGTVARNPASPAEVIELLAGDRELRVRCAARRHPRAPSRERLRAILLGSEHGQRLLRAEDPEAGFEELVALCSDSDMGIREAVAANPAFQPGDELIEALSASVEGEARMFAGEYRGTPASILERLARDESASVRAAVAGNVAAPLHVLSLLVEDVQSFVQWTLAENPGTPPELLERLVTVGDRFTRDRVARNPHTPPALLGRLVRDRVAIADVAANPNTSVDVLLAIVDLPDGARLSPWRALAERKDLPWAVAERFIQNRLTRVFHSRLLAASSLPLPAGVLEAMAQSSLDGERFFAARHPGTPLFLLERLAEDAEPLVRWTVTENVGAPRALVDRIRRAFVASVAVEAGLLGRLVALSCPEAAPSEDLTQAALSSSCWLERYALASNPHVPAPVLARLADDPNEWVRHSSSSSSRS